MAHGPASSCAESALSMVAFLGPTRSRMIAAFSVREPKVPKIRMTGRNGA